MKNITIKNLCIYPIKSCTGFAINTTEILNNGFKYDRFYAVLNSDNQILTARENQNLLHIQTKIIDNQLTLTAPNQQKISFNLNEISDESISVKIFKDFTNAKVVKKEIDTWLSIVLKENCTLVHIDSEALRSMKSKYNGKENDVITFSDAAPIHLTSEASLNDLNSKLEDSVSINNFRSNIVVSGCEPFEEDNWKSVKIGKCEFEVAIKTARCSFITINPETAKISSKSEPLKTLAQYRRDKNKVNFGIYLIPKNTGVINSTDTLTITYK